VKKSRLKVKPRVVSLSLSLILSMELIVMNIVLTSGFIYGKTEKLCRKELQYSSSIGQELRKKKLIALMTFNCTWY
jgi:hypothetical protein